MRDSVPRIRVRRFGRQELLELARWESSSRNHGWSVGDGEMSVDIDEDGGEYVSLYLDAVSGGPVYFVKPGFGLWSLVNGRGGTKTHPSLRAALEYVCPTLPSGEVNTARQPGAVVVNLPNAASRLTLCERPHLVSRTP